MSGHARYQTLKEPDMAKPKTTSNALADMAKRVAENTAERDALIATRAAEGATLREIAEEAGLAHTTIRNILNRQRGVPEMA